jgi:selenide,water dikinase
LLGKPLGVGILSAALKKGLLDETGYQQMLHYTTQLNRVGTELGAMPGVHAMTDVTGFGLAGHLLEMCRGSQLAAEIEMARVPMIPTAVGFARDGVATGASARNWAGYGEQVLLPPTLLPWQQALLTDPQTSGGLLVSCSTDASHAVLARFHAAGFERAAVTGRLVAGEPQLRVI